MFILAIFCAIGAYFNVYYTAVMKKRISLNRKTNHDLVTWSQNCISFHDTFPHLFVMSIYFWNKNNVWHFEMFNFTHCWTTRACGKMRGDLLFVGCSIVPCSLSLNAAISSCVLIRNIPRPWLRPVGLQIHMLLLSLHTPNTDVIMFNVSNAERKLLKWLRRPVVILYH